MDSCFSFHTVQFSTGKVEEEIDTSGKGFLGCLVLE